MRILERLFVAVLAAAPPAQGLGAITVENRSPRARAVVQVATVPFKPGEYRLGARQVLALDVGLAGAQRCQVEPWLAPYRDGSQRCVRLEYEALLPANDLRIHHRIELGDGIAPRPFELAPEALVGLRDLWIVFFCGPKQTHWVPVFGPGLRPREVVRDGALAKTYRYFARVDRPPHAPAMRSQVWAELDVTLLARVPYLLLQARWGIDHPAINEYAYDRTNWTDEETEVGFYMVTGSADSSTARLRPLEPASCVRTLEWEAPAWRWVWDRRTRNASGLVLNDRIPWGCALHAQAAVTFGTSDAAEAWHDAPYMHDAVSDQWRVKTEAYEAWGAMPRREKAIEHWQGWDAERVRGALEGELTNMIDIGGERYCQESYAWNHQPTQRIESLWHQMDGQTGGTHGYWFKSPCIAAVHYDLPGEAHYVRRGLYICPWPYSGYREEDGRMFSCLDHTMTASNRGQPGGNIDRHGKSAPPPYSEHPLLFEPRSGGRLWGADVAHFETGWPHVHSAIFGDDGTRRICESLVYGPVQLANWNLDPEHYASTGEQRAWARGMTGWARSLWVFGGDRRLVDYCADSFLAFHVLPDYARTDVEFPGRVVGAPYFLYPRNEGDQRVNLANYRFFRPWELGHADGEWSIAEIASATRPELEWFRGHAKKTAECVFKYGAPRIVDEQTGRILETFYRQGIYEPGQAVGIAAGATRQLTFPEMSDNNWTRCAAINGQGQCGDPPTNDGYMRLGMPGNGTSSFTTGMAGLVLDGPLGDPVLSRYAEQGPHRKSSRPNDNSHMSWLDGLYRWKVGVVEEIVLGGETARGAHPAPLRSLAASGTKPDAAWCLGADALELRAVSTGEVLPMAAALKIEREGKDEPSGAAGLEAVTTGIEGGRKILAGLLPVPGGARVIAYEEATLRPIGDWAFRVPGAPRGLCWAPQLLAFLVATEATDGPPALWSYRPGDVEATRISLPAADGRIILDAASIMSVSSTIDGRLLVITERSGNAWFYAWNARVRSWGGPRLNLWAPLSTWSPHVREDDALLLLSDDPVGSRLVERKS